MRSIALCLIATLGFVACTRGPKGLSRSAYPAMEKTADALKRANEYRDAGALIYEPRFLEVEKTLDELAAARSNAQDASASIMARACSDELRTYRDNLADLNALFMEEHSAAIGKLTKDEIALHNKLAAMVDACIADVRSYLQ